MVLVTTSHEGQDGWSPGRETVDFTTVPDDSNTKPRGTRGTRRSPKPRRNQTETNAASSPVPDLPVRPGIEPPTMGWPAFRFRWNLKKRKQDPDNPGYVLVPRPNAKEQAQRDERDYLVQIEASKRELAELTNTQSRGIVLFINSKGNGATTTSMVWTASGLCIETGKEVTAFDANWASGTAAQRLRLDHTETVSERRLADNLDALGQTHGAFNEYVRSNTDRVRVVAAKSIMEGGGKLTAHEYMRAAQLAFDNCDYLYVDTPNDIASDQLLALASMADVLVFTANVGEQDSLRQLGSSMQTLRNHWLGEKVNRSVVLINNLPNGKTANDYRMYQHLVNMLNEIEVEQPGHVGPFVGIRHDRAIAEARPVNYAALRRETAQDIRLANIAIQRQLPEKKALLELHEDPSRDGPFGQPWNNNSEEGASS